LLVIPAKAECSDFALPLLLLLSMIALAVRFCAQLDEKSRGSLDSAFAGMTINSEERRASDANLPTKNAGLRRRFFKASTLAAQRIRNSSI
jgi:hypothetical protein